MSVDLSISGPARDALRLPPSRLTPTRVGFLSLGSISITLEMWIGPSCSITPPT